MKPFLAPLFLLALTCQEVSAQEPRLSKRMAMADERVTAQVMLAPSQHGVLKASLRDSTGGIWTATRALTGSTLLDLTQLITSMTPERQGASRFQFGWHDTLRTVVTVQVGDKELVDTLQQVFVTSALSATSIRDHGLVGTYITPRTGGRRPALLVLGGSEGGLSSEGVAALLASHGYAALALAYFGTDSLPAALDRIPIETFLRALRWLTKQPGVDAHRLGIFGTSKGAEAALLVASLDSSVHAVVAYAPSSVVWSCICGEAHSSWSRENVDIPFIPAGTDPQYRVAPGTPLQPAVNYRYRMRDSAVSAAAAIDVQRINGPLMLVAGDADALWPSADMLRAIQARRGPHRSRDEALVYPGAGHLIGKAYLPAGSTLIAGGRIDTGGSPLANASAQADAWRRVLRFLARALKNYRSVVI